MAYEVKPGQGSLFKNKRKDSDKHPDYTGEVHIPPGWGGKKVNIAAWLKTSQKGTKFMSLNLSDPSDRKPSAKQDAKADMKKADLDDEIPF